MRLVMRSLRTASCAALLAIPPACSSSEPSPPAAAVDSGAAPPVTTPPLDDAAQRTKTVQEMHDVLLSDVKTLAAAALEIQNAAPLPTGRGWDKTDAAALATMRASWLKARTAYEHIEGALAPLFPDIDSAIDARYDDFLAELVGKGGDAYLFDDQGVTGMHAVERILFAETIPPRVVEFERVLPGYVAAAAPATAQEAADFKNKLCAKLVADTKRLTAEWTPAKIDVRIAYAGLIALVAEQAEKVKKAATGEEESRYAQRTMSDLRDNLDGTKKVYAIFQPWLTSKASPSADLDRAILAGLAALDASYKAVTGDAIPEPPATWSAESPSAADLQTPFGKLYTAVTNQVDASKNDSVVSKLDAAGILLGFPPTN
jgi:iron uptake system component EfeO